MLTISEVSGLIAAAVMIVQYVLPAALIVIFVKYLGADNSAETWSVVNRTIATTLWPHILRADTVQMRHVPFTVTMVSWSLTFTAMLLVVASISAPLGLRDQIVPRESRVVQFEYVPDRSPWGRFTMARPNSKFSRNCQYGADLVNCPGQYQGLYMNETRPGHYESVKTDPDSTINVTIPENYTTMFSSATSEQGCTMSGLFDIQYRRWQLDRSESVENGEPFVKGHNRYIQSLITQETIVLVEGLVIDMRSNPGIGFRNHTVPIGLEHGGSWTEDLTWIEPVTQCADTNLSIRYGDGNTADSLNDTKTFWLIDRGAYNGLNVHVLESPPWTDNQTLDLYGRAYKAARMHNVLVAFSLGVALPLEPGTNSLPPMIATTRSRAPPNMYNYGAFDQVLMSELTGVGGFVPNITGFNRSKTYDDGLTSLVAMNYSAITQICRGYYSLSNTEIDRRANNITNPLVECGYVLGAQSTASTSNFSNSTYNDGLSIHSRKLYVCASGVTASVKSIDFLYNGTEGELSNLRVTDIRDKVYLDDASKPLWAVESSWPRAMQFDALWGMVSHRFEKFDRFHTLRSEKLWLPASPFMAYSFGMTDSPDALAGAGGFSRPLGNLYYRPLTGPDYSSENDYILLERWQRLSRNENTASQIPSLVVTDGLAANLVGTKTSISRRYIPYPASLAVDGVDRGYPQARVMVYKRVLRYDIRFAIPSFLLLVILLLALIWCLAILMTSHSVIIAIRNMYNQTSTGRLATSLLRPGRYNPKQSSRSWTSGDGRLLLSFGQIENDSLEEDPFCTILEDTADAMKGSDRNSTDVAPSPGPNQSRVLSTSQENQALLGLGSSVTAIAS